MNNVNFGLRSYKMKIRLFVVLLSALPAIRCDVSSASTGNALKDFPPYVKMILCPMQRQPWECFREQSGRVLDLLDNSYQTKWNQFKDEVNTEIVAKFQSRGFSASDKVKEKTQSIFENIETGVSDIKDFAESTANELLGREDDEQDIEYDFDDSLELDIDDADEKKKGGGNKIKKKKKKPFQGAITSHDDDDGTDDVELAADLLGGLGGGHGIKLPLKHVTRGKKKKKKKAIMKILMIGSVIKSKIELLLKLLSAHLQIKFFAISVIGLLLNLVRFWLDIKGGHGPQKVIYYEHAHHQHHYDEHDDWDHGGYWRRSNTPSSEYATEGLDEDSPYSRVGRNDYFPSSPSASLRSSPSLTDAPNRMAYARQISPGV
ncbi:uncharacterized protein LOC119650373 isoform X2 [Hermetia illucens]|nr:uncharacterized protein LOC119650373 isoform X2 [Hermetia illucens]